MNDNEIGGKLPPKSGKLTYEDDDDGSHGLFDFLKKWGLSTSEFAALGYGSVTDIGRLLLECYDMCHYIVESDVFVQLVIFK